MGIEPEVDRTLYIRNLDPRVTEELLFELFLQAGPLIKIIIPKSTNDAQRKSFAFALYKHEVSVPYAMQLLNGTTLFGRKISVQFRSGSKHGTGNSPANPQDSVYANTPNPHGQRTPVQLNSPPYTPPQLQRSFSTPENLQKHVTMNNMMLQLHMQQLEQLNAFCKPLQRQPGPGGNGGGSWQHDNSHRHHPSQMNSGGRNQRYADEPGSGRHWDSYHHQNDRSGSRHYDNRGSNRHHDDRGSNRNYQDGRWRKY